MHIGPASVGLALFGFLVIGGTIDGTRRKIAAQPDWVAMNWKSVVKGTLGWLALGVLALLGAMIAAFF